MQRRTFLSLPAAGVLAADLKIPDLPSYRSVSSYKPAPKFGMPGPLAGRVVSVHAAKAVEGDTINTAVVRTMMDRGMCALTNAPHPIEAWRHFFEPQDVVGIKVNCSGAPNVCSRPEVVAEVVRNLNAVGVKPAQIWVYERFDEQVASVNYPRYLPEGVNVYVVETPRGSIRNYDPRTYVEVNFFGEDDTRSNLVRLVSERFTKIINVPNMKDHGAAGVTGCLKNIAYGNFSNVARSHQNEKTNTKTFIATLASLEPLRSKTVLSVMDGLRGVWHGGPFVLDPKWVFYPKQIKFGTDPVAMDRLLLDIIEAERKKHGAVSVWERSMKYVHKDGPNDPNTNRFIREPGHIEYAAGLGLGVYDIKSIRHQEIEIA
ncbi:MAG: DUF362 domain-containing protein [Bryobacteraceae bacterium]